MVCGLMRTSGEHRGGCCQEQGSLHRISLPVLGVQF
jgi:hypothetical protein